MNKKHINNNKYIKRLKMNSLKLRVKNNKR